MVINIDKILDERSDKEAPYCLVEKFMNGLLISQYVHQISRSHPTPPQIFVSETIVWTVSRVLKDLPPALHKDLGNDAASHLEANAEHSTLDKTTQGLT